MKPKFRFWNTVTKKWVHPSSVVIWDECIHIVHEDCPDVNDNTIGACNVHIESQQFTGIIDKNGKEIYEGDIVVEEHDHDKDYIYDDVFTYMEHHVIAKHHGYFTHDEDDRLSLVANTNGDGQNSYVEVVGNIYDNPELKLK